jgi:hypothetical protein
LFMEDAVEIIIISKRLKSASGLVEGKRRILVSIYSMTNKMSESSLCTACTQSTYVFLQ